MGTRGGIGMNTNWYGRLMRVMVGLIAAVAVIGGAMSMSAIAHAHAGPMAAPIARPYAVR
jgi:hypothetical protein